MRCTKAVAAANQLDLEKLKDVPVPEIVQFGGITFVNNSGQDVAVTTWREYTRCLQQKIPEKTNADIAMSGWFWDTRGHIPFLEVAVPATNSYLRHLRPGRGLVRLLPLALAPLLSEESNAVGQAIRLHQSWLQFYPATRITKLTDTEMALKMGRYRMTVTILAYGDFNRDGLDDLLICYHQDVTDGSFSYAGVAVLTRTTPDGALSLIE